MRRYLTAEQELLVEQDLLRYVVAYFPRPPRDERRLKVPWSLHRGDSVSKAYWEAYVWTRWAVKTGCVTYSEVEQLRLRSMVRVMLGLAS